MITLPLRLRATVSSRSETAELLCYPSDAVLIERGRPRVFLILCPCGCGDELSINLDDGAGPAWRMYRRFGRFTIFPSVWRDTGCGSHFIIWANNVLLFGPSEEAGEDELSATEPAIDQQDLLNAVTDHWESCDVIADRIDRVPWDVLKACRALTRTGLIVEGKKELRGRFRRG